MTLTDSFPTEDAGGLSIADTRLILAGLIARSAAGVPRLGVIPVHTSPLVTGTAGMAYSVAAFYGVSSRNGTGIELVANDGPASVATDAAPGSNSRIDVIWWRCRFGLYSDSLPYTAEFGVTKGTAALTPTKPSIPSGASELATAVVLSTTVATSTAVITQTFAYTAPEGGVVLLRNQTEHDAWVPHEGSRGYRLDTQRGYEYMGATIGWVHVSGKPEIGTLTPNAAGGISAGTPAPRVFNQGGRIFSEGAFSAGSQTWTSGTTYGVGIANSVPAAFAPKVEQRFPVVASFVFPGEMIVGTDGSIGWRPATTFTTGLYLPLNGFAWPDKRLV